ncbi:MAG: hypothetical protein PHS93_06425 [Candidatus Omnitrophica bacterium]|nr:hypothetical protein [Candidatus Omnitrophota bacterium]MDD5352784.1 hypothetical protein [Candidatus Omnitrophota bacterium]MDD5550383.1 hypothetical protein [Candidatus Omnitrophota bacterium]
MNVNPITVLNLMLCVIIFAFGYLGFKKSNNRMIMSIAIAFGLFGISHLMLVLHAARSLAFVLILIRTAAYLIVLLTFSRAAFKK